jgi:hypothetical protein
MEINNKKNNRTFEKDLSGGKTFGFQSQNESETILSELLKNTYVDTNVNQLLLNAVVDAISGKDVQSKEYLKDFSISGGYQSPKGYGIDLGYNVPNELGGFNDYQIGFNFPIQDLLNKLKNVKK